MQKESFEHISSRLDADDLGLGWLSGVTYFKTSQARAMHSHVHTNLELIFCLHGELVYEITGFGAVTLHAGMGIVIPVRTRHKLKRGTETPGERLGLHILSALMPERTFAVFAPRDFKTLRKSLALHAAHPFRADAALVSTVRELAAVLERANAHPAKSGIDALASRDLALARARILSCSILYRTAELLAVPRPNDKPHLIDEATRFLEAHLAEPFRVATLVRHMGYSRTRLFELFHQRFGLSPNEYLTRARIRKAEELLATTQSSAADVARQTGFPSAAYFGAVFKRYTGHTPGTAKPEAH